MRDGHICVIRVRNTWKFWILLAAMTWGLVDFGESQRHGNRLQYRQTSGYQTHGKSLRQTGKRHFIRRLNHRSHKHLKSKNYPH
ncbi:unnamed protein product [Darwinula stevensoni]|uniref:Uncharacterized protein n=1 Tax=Darwinula stevensoni TaxID=69355 RepID=A0A7R8X684_9CRUS|nr:unnamed protein product [Darwinula stevensoni]CAG0887828.1 unnamed protein product [Darwinula stevensoni]